MTDSSPPNPTADDAAVWITCYLSAHPRAADTAEGIQRWWLAPHFGEVALEKVELALGKLESEGVVQISDPLALNPTFGRGPALSAPH
jgi:hypothetical protein